ncbi:MAG TPA: HAMP domain-containing sensor histidine kinase [Gallionella sp.]|nr:HAMP domain-containing sensor histidine kinase [Gallionella sp.]
MMILDADTVLAAAVHEVKNMMGELTLCLDDYYRHHPDAEVAKMRALSHTSQERMVQILIMQNAENGALGVTAEAISPQELLDDVVADAKLMLPEGMTLEQDSDVADVPFWFIDRYLISQVLMNALHNAVKFANSRIVLGCREADDGLLFDVRDDGAGYPDRPGFRLEAAQEHQGGNSKKGTGLGLRFNERIAAVHGGKITRSNDGGACFTLWLPK